MKRQEIIQRLIDLGAKDLTKEKIGKGHDESESGKRLYRIYITERSYYDFKFDYKEYKYLYLFGNYGKEYKTLNFKDFDEFVENKIIRLWRIK